MGYLLMIPRGLMLAAALPGRLLAPVTFRQNPPVVMVIPAMRHPVGIPPRRHFPPSRPHGITAAIPILISTNPHIAWARRPNPVFHEMRWRNLNHNLGRRGAQGQRAHKRNSDQSLQKHNDLLMP